jgi:ElaA protein
MDNLRWVRKFFDELTPFELYEVIRLRNEVFVVEQNCVYQDADNKDGFCYHLLGYTNDNLAAYSRLIPEGVSYAGKPSIGRVVTSPAYRQFGFGRALMTEAIRQCHLLFGLGTIKIGAQLYLKEFYRSFGFIQCSEVYDEDGIPHIEMIKE